MSLSVTWRSEAPLFLTCLWQHNALYLSFSPSQFIPSHFLWSLARVQLFQVCRQTQTQTFKTNPPSLGLLSVWLQTTTWKLLFIVTCLLAQLLSARLEESSSKSSFTRSCHPVPLRDTTGDLGESLSCVFPYRLSNSKKS